MKTLLTLSILMSFQMATAKPSINKADPAMAQKKQKLDCPFKKSGNAFASRDITPHGAIADSSDRSNTLSTK